MIILVKMMQNVYLKTHLTHATVQLISTENYANSTILACRIHVKIIQHALELIMILSANAQQINLVKYANILLILAKAIRATTTQYVLKTFHCEVTYHVSV